MASTINSFNQSNNVSEVNMLPFRFSNRWKKLYRNSIDIKWIQNGICGVGRGHHNQVYDYSLHQVRFCMINSRNNEVCNQNVCREQSLKKPFVELVAKKRILLHNCLDNCTIKRSDSLLSIYKPYNSSVSIIWSKKRWFHICQTEKQTQQARERLNFSVCTYSSFKLLKNRPINQVLH